MAQTGGIGWFVMSVCCNLPKRSISSNGVMYSLRHEFDFQVSYPPVSTVSSAVTPGVGTSTSMAELAGSGMVSQCSAINAKK
jgi:hypothetical protein